MHNPIMVSERLYLRSCEMTDAETIARFTAEETDTFMYRGRRPISPLAYAHILAEEYKSDPPHEITLAVCHVADDRLIGLVGLEAIDWVNRTAETFSELGTAEIRGQGYGTEAKHLLLAYAFDHLQFHILRSAVFEANTRSMAALAKQGYRPAGRLRWANVKDGIYQDQCYFDLLRDEWLVALDAWRAMRER